MAVAGEYVVATLLRMQPYVLHKSRMQLQVGAGAEWADFEFRLRSRMGKVGVLEAPQLATGG